MKYDKFFDLAKAAGIEECEISVTSSYSLSFSLFHGEIDSYETNSSSFFMARGIYKGKMGAVTSDVYTKDSPKLFVDAIIKNASVIESDEPVFIFKGSEKYKKVNTFNRDLEKISVDEKLKKLYQLEDLIRKADKRITEVQTVGYQEASSSSTIMNSHGLKLSQKNNDYAYYGGAVAKDGDQVKTGFDIFLSNDFSKVDIEKLAKSIVEETVSQLGGEACDSATYKAVLAPEVISAFMGAYIGSAIAEDVQKNSSLFVGKLHEKVASNKVTIECRPVERTLFARWFDDEGVATKNFPIIKNGTLETYLYNLTTAAKDGVESTGNGAVGGGSKVYTSPWFTVMKPGKKTQEELFKEVDNGVYITEVSGLHSGLNPRSGNFSLQSTGFMIENGKLTHPLDIITVNGNLVDLFKSINAVGSDSKEFLSARRCPSVMVKKLNVSGK